MNNPQQTSPLVTGNTQTHTGLWLLHSWLEKFHAHSARLVMAFSSTSRFTKLSSASASDVEVVTKLIAAEEHVVSTYELLRVVLIVYRPTLIYVGSASDSNEADIARLIRKLGFFPVFGIGTGCRQFVDAADLAKACLQSLAVSTSCKQAYNLSGGETLTYRDMVGRIFQNLERQPRFTRISLVTFRLAVMMARLHSPLAHLTADMALRMQADLVFDHGDAMQDFGYSPVTVDPPYLTAPH